MVASMGASRRARIGVALLAALCALAGSAAPARSAATDWPGYGLDDANSRDQTSEKLLGPISVWFVHALWRNTTMKGSTGTPAVVGGVVYATGYDGTVRALQARTGAEVWRTQVVPNDGTADPVIDDSPAVANGRVYVGTGQGDVVALDQATGAELWRVRTAPWPETHIWSSPRVFGDHLVIGVGSGEVGEEKDTYVTHGFVLSLDPATGAEQWRFYTTAADGSTGAGGSVWSSAAYDANLGTVYIGTGQQVDGTNSPYTDALLALDVNTGALRWHRQYTSGDLYRIFKLPPNGLDYDIGASPNLFTINGRAVVGVADKGGRYAVWDRATGDPVWGVQLTPGSHLGGTMQTAAVSGGSVFVSSNTMAGGPFALGNKTTVFALDQNTGATRWQVTLPTAAFGAITHAKGVVYVPTVSGVLYTFRASDGRQLRKLLPSGRTHAWWSADSTDSLAGGVSVSNGVIFAPFGWTFFVKGSTDTRKGGVAAFGF